MKPFLVSLLSIALLAGAAWWLLRDKAPEERALHLPPVVEIEPEPLIRHPVPERLPQPEPEADEAQQQDTEVSVLAAVLPASLPELDQSDQALFSIVEYLVANPRLAELLAPRDLIRRFVITIDGLGGPAVPLDHLPVSSPGGTFLVERAGEVFRINPRNYERYRQHVAFLDQLDSRRLAETYIHFYPLFQQAYRELGYPQGFFNDRLVTVIDELIATPEITDPVPLEQPHVFYVYADPALEERTAGQKLLLRMGPDNATIIKRKLREIRQQIVR